ncbi:MAG: hypothetical protein ACD_9C00298G0001, partial [uncultured bacterium]
YSNEKDIREKDIREKRVDRKFANLKKLPCGDRLGCGCYFENKN